jgi:hypothetical protein
MTPSTTAAFLRNNPDQALLDIDLLLLEEQLNLKAKLSQIAPKSPCFPD